MLAERAWSASGPGYGGGGVRSGLRPLPRLDGDSVLGDPT